MIRNKLSRAVLWFVQLASLLTILWCSWLLLDREGFALVAAIITLVTSLYLEHTSEEVD
jgi:hypothetical protein